MVKVPVSSSNTPSLREAYEKEFLAEVPRERRALVQGARVQVVTVVRGRIPGRGRRRI